MASAVHDAAIELQAVLLSSRRLRQTALPSRQRFDTTKLAPVSSAPDFLELSSDEESDADDNNTSTSRYDDEDYGAISDCSTLSDYDEPEPSKKETPTVELSVVADETDLAAKLYARMVELDALKTDMLQAVASAVQRLDAFIAITTEGPTTFSDSWDGALPLGTALDRQLGVWALALHEWAALQRRPLAQMSTSVAVQADVSSDNTPRAQNGCVQCSVQPLYDQAPAHSTSEWNERLTMAEEECSSLRVRTDECAALYKQERMDAEHEKALLALQVASMERRLDEALRQVALNLELAAEQKHTYELEATEVDRLKSMNIRVLEALIEEDGRLQAREAAFLAEEQQLRDRLLQERVALERFKKTILTELIHICTALEVAPTTPGLQQRLRAACRESTLFFGHAPSTA